MTKYPKHFMGTVTLLLVLSVGYAPQCESISVPSNHENKIILTPTTAPIITPSGYNYPGILRTNKRHDGILHIPSISVY